MTMPLASITSHNTQTIAYELKFKTEKGSASLIHKGISVVMPINLLTNT